MILIRVSGILFAVVQITLALRLLLPFVAVPASLAEFVPPLMVVTDWWLAPWVAVIDALDVLGVSSGLDPAVGEDEIVEPQEFEPAVVVAMIGWAIVAAFVVFVLRLIFRPTG